MSVPNNRQSPKAQKTVFCADIKRQPNDYNTKIQKCKEFFINYTLIVSELSVVDGR